MTCPKALAENLLAAYSERFVNRTLPYAVQQPDGTYRWCYEACTTEVTAAHLSGEMAVALSSTDVDGRCRWLCLDVDDAAPDSFARLLTLRAALAVAGLPGLVESSRRGGHLWLLLDDPVPATQARLAVFAALDSLHRQGVDLPVCELYPDTGAPGTLGHAVRLPLGIHLLTGRHYPLFDDDSCPCAFTSIEAAVWFVLGWPRISAQVVADWAAKYHPVSFGDVGVEPAALAQDDTPHRGNVTKVGTRSAVIRWVDTQISPLDVLAELATDVEPRLMGLGYLGWCPFHDDRAPDEQGQPGTPSFYLVQDRCYGWSWRCLSSNCPQHVGLMRHTFRLLQELLGLTTVGAIRAARARWPEAGKAERSDEA